VCGWDVGVWLGCRCVVGKKVYHVCCMSKYNGKHTAVLQGWV